MTPTFDSQLFRQTLGQFATGVTVVSFIREGQVCAMTANSFTSVSLDPPLVLFCPARTTRFALDAEVNELFTISILAEGQEDVSRHFAGRPNLKEKPWLPNDQLPPTVEGSVGWIRCRSQTIHTHGDHLVVVAQVLEFGCDPSRRPLLFFRGDYLKLEP